MKKKRHLIKSIWILLLAVFLMTGTATAVSAKEAAGDSSRSEELNAYIKELLETIDTAGTELSELSGMIDEIDAGIEENSRLLKQAEKESQVQEESMRKRIRYLYESGRNFNMIEALLAADSIGDALNRSAYISRIVDYDREMLSRYIVTIDSINALQKELKESRAKLVELQDSYQQTGIELSQVVAEVPDKMAELGVDAEDIDQVIEDYKEEHAAPAETEAETETESAVIQEETEEEATEAAEETEETTTKQERTTKEEPTETEPAAPEEETDSSTPGSPNDDPIWNLARITYLENGVMYPESSYRSIYLTACVVINRANAWYGGSIMDSIYAPGAYATAYKYDSWTGGELVINDITWQAVNEALANTDPNPFYQCNGSWLEGSGLKEYYRDPVTDEVFYYLN